MADAEIVIRGLDITTGSADLLSGVDFELPPRRFVALMGPMGSGKSTFIKYLAGQLGEELRAKAASATYRGDKLEAANCAILVGQHVRESASAERESRNLLASRLLEINNAIASSDDLLCVDEPTSGLSEQDGAVLMVRLRTISADRSVVMVSHNLSEVSDYCDQIALFGGGRVLDHLETPVFMEAGPDTFAGHFVRTGGLSLPSATTPESHLSTEFRQPPHGFNCARATREPGEYRWIIDDRLGMTPLDVGGAGEPLSFDGDDLSRILTVMDSSVTIWGSGVGGTIVDWVEAKAPNRDLVAPLGLCRRIDELLGAGYRVTINTARNLPGSAALLGVYLVHRGFPPDAAVELTAKKVPELRLGMRVEELLWNVDLEIACAS